MTRHVHLREFLVGVDVPDLSVADGYARWSTMQQPAASLVPEATEAAYLGLPAVLIWALSPQRES